MKQSQASHRGRKPCSELSTIGFTRRGYVMPREILECPIAPPRGRLRKDIVQEDYTIELITPVFGGGVQAGRNDPITPIRVSGIRGQLRFWWRATRGANFATVSDLRKREGQIWGTTRDASPVVVEIMQYEISQEDQKRWAEHPRNERGDGVKSLPRPLDRNFPMYALFPFQGKTEKDRGIYSVREQPAVAIWKASFGLRVSWPKLVKRRNGAQEEIDSDVRAALWAWLNFGGLGSRTRRGCGALYSDRLAPGGNADIGKWYEESLQRLGIPLSDSPRDWPTLPPTLLHGPRKMSPREAWNSVVSLLQKFRQGPGIGRNPGSGNRPGRSYWPEPESIREISDEQHGRASRPPNRKQKQPHMETRYFPRAEFGMPIIFEIRGEGLKPTLQPAADVSRMASPLILKPLAVSANRAVPMIMRLNTKPVDQAVLQGPDLRGPHHVESTGIRDARLASYSDSPLRGLSVTGSAVEAFINFVLKNGFQEVGR